MGVFGGVVLTILLVKTLVSSPYSSSLFRGNHSYYLGKIYEVFHGSSVAVGFVCFGWWPYFSYFSV